ncbi:nucleotidyltransferase domain-containing protein [Sorangium sp. So ce854]|uniref:nucleotidyltransferase domain-containing protein n=1 Tax=Sorangium sp. So ce854 TaxID=3133322 RepID=UPI003F62643D
MTTRDEGGAPRSAIERIAEKAGTSWPSIEAAARHSAETRARLAALLREQIPCDTSAVVFGSLARGEYTSGSDLDWTLLIDGQADEGHFSQVQAITKILREAKFHEPGPTGVFGNVAFSHPILHQIGGQEDTNKNTTQRILLLLESLAIGKPDAHERVLRLVLSRYVEDDRGLHYGSKREIIPMFLLNDIVRYWRTVAVDFVYKQRERSSGWALRNAKLRMSRKLIFVSGLITCFGFELFGKDRAAWAGEGGTSTPALVRFLRERIRVTPLESLAEVLLRPSISAETARALFDSYDAFLALLSNEEERGRLKQLPLDDHLGHDPTFKRVRDIGRAFQDGLNRLFFKEDDELSELIQRYGVF